MGIPVFAQMKAGPHVLFGPTAGHIYGFIIAAYIAGIFSEKGLTKNPTQCFVSCFISTTIILLSGALYLSFFKGVNDALILGFYPFLLGDVIKSAVAALLIVSLRRV
jgi:biotin transport system substrate-specific component